MKLSKDELGKRYAKALFEFASEKNIEDDIEKELEILQEVMDNNSDFLVLFASPALSLIEKNDLLVCLKEHFSSEMQRFLQLVFDYHRMATLQEIVFYYKKLADHKARIGHGVAISATKMSGAQISALEQTMKEKNHLSEFVLTNEVDPTILGGVILESDGTIIDGSIRTKIATLKNNLVESI